MPADLSLPFSGQRSRELRERAGLTRPALAAKIAEGGKTTVSPQHIRRVELGESGTTPTLVKAIADALGVDIDALLDSASAS